MHFWSKIVQNLMKGPLIGAQFAKKFWIYLPILCMFVHVHFLTNRFVAAKSERKHKQKTNEYFEPAPTNVFEWFGNFKIRFKLKFVTNLISNKSIELGLNRLAHIALKVRQTRSEVKELYVIVDYSVITFRKFVQWIVFVFFCLFSSSWQTEPINQSTKFFASADSKLFHKFKSIDREKIDCFGRRCKHKSTCRIITQFQNIWYLNKN